ncbi:hypothetical protein [Methylomonas methanica]|uniref:hypothetical protein n=1 Tax=Methylomonas methanica TaxID=421 RepID=UPI0011D20728|nr:hypothetical protein [Methylomonas methanica]
MSALDFSLTPFQGLSLLIMAAYKSLNGVFEIADTAKTGWLDRFTGQIDSTNRPTTVCNDNAQVVLGRQP